MPNWTTNRIMGENLKDLEINGKKVFIEDDTDKEQIVDYERIFPMPETLREVSSPPDEKSVVCYLTDHFSKDITDETCQKIIDVCHGRYQFHTFEEFKKQYQEMIEKGRENPDEEVPLYLGIERSAPTISLYDKGKLYVDNVENYGAPTWYEWACENWGVKWNACECYWIDDETIEFQSPWGPPGGFFEKLAETFPELEAKLVWADEDYGSGCGGGLIKSGSLHAKMAEPCSVEAYRIAQYMLGGAYWIEEEAGRNWAWASESSPETVDSAERQYAINYRKAKTAPFDIDDDNEPLFIT